MATQWYILVLRVLRVYVHIYVEDITFIVKKKKKDDLPERCLFMMRFNIITDGTKNKSRVHS